MRTSNVYLLQLTITITLYFIETIVYREFTKDNMLSLTMAMFFIMVIFPVIAMANLPVFWLKKEPKAIFIPILIPTIIIFFISTIAVFIGSYDKFLILVLILNKIITSALGYLFIKYDSKKIN